MLSYLFIRDIELYFSPGVLLRRSGRGRIKHSFHFEMKLFTCRPTEDREVPGMRAPPKQRAKKANVGSGVLQKADEMTGQTSGGSLFGSGGSAFRVSPEFFCCL